MVQTLRGFGEGKITSFPLSSPSQAVTVNIQSVKSLCTKHNWRRACQDQSPVLGPMMTGVESSKSHRGLRRETNGTVAWVLPNHHQGTLRRDQIPISRTAFKLLCGEWSGGVRSQSRDRGQAWPREPRMIRKWLGQVPMNNRKLSKWVTSPFVPTGTVQREGILLISQRRSPTFWQAASGI